MFTSLPARWLAVLPAVAALSAVAQTAPAPEAPADPALLLSYRSAMEGYRPFADEKPIPWKEANETVYRRGGWRAYAEEASEGADGASGKGSNPHAGHAMPMPAAAPSKEKP